MMRFSFATTLIVACVALGAGCKSGSSEEPSCGADQVLCGAACIDTSSDRLNCGSCGTPCGEGYACRAGTCVVDCPPWMATCAEAKTCTDLQSDRAHCGACGTTCKVGEVCSAGKCAISCHAGLTDCAGSCVNTETDRANCGACGTACKAGEVCSGGKCALSCVEGTTDCGGSCVKTDSDRAHCGACGTACKSGEVCSAGKCAVSCLEGLTECGGSCVNTKSDRANCGACATACDPGKVCDAGTCVLSCESTLTNCAGSCVNTQTDRANCGACGTSCPAGQVCSAGACVASCATPLTACSAACVDPRFDPEHCGGCGKACAAVANGTRACLSSVCTVGACNTGFADCDGKLDTGCEVNLAADDKNCGGCKLACAPGTNCCGTGTCVSTLTDPNNCGACGNKCGTGETCCSGKCLGAAAVSPCGADSCGKVCNSTGTTGTGFATTGTVDQLEGTDTGITTIPASKSPPPSASPFIWIAMHDSNSVNKIDAKTGAVLGTYPSRGGNPSRGVAALDGSFWVGNRGQNCVVNDPTCSNVAQILPDGTPGCTVGKAADGAPMPFIRALAIDKNGFIWAGTWNDMRVHKIDPKTCKTVLDITMNKGGFQSYPYGFAIDSQGILWNSNIGSGSGVMGIDTVTGTIKYTVSHGGNCTYGITVDKKDNVWFGMCSSCNGGAYRIDAVTRVFSSVAGSNGRCSNGIATDLDGNLHIAQPGSPSYVTKLENGTGKLLATYSFPGVANGYGIAADVYGKVWYPGYSNNQVVRFDRLTGAVELTKPLVGATPYTYSDWNGLTLRTITSNNAQAGTWTNVYDSGASTTTWTSASWSATTPAGTAAKLTFRAATTKTGLAGAPSCGPFFASPVDLTPCGFMNKQFLQATVSLETGDVNVQPKVDDLKVYWVN